MLYLFSDATLYVGITLLLFILGTIFGSFLNVVATRSVQGKSWITGRSRCDSCKHVLNWYDMIPLFSYLFLMGKCRACRATIDISHPLIEFLVGSLFVWWFWFGFGILGFFQLTHAPFSSIQPLFWLIIALLLGYIALIDIRHYLIPDAAVVITTLLILGYRLALWGVGIMQLSDVWHTVYMTIGITIFMFFLWAITKGKGMGFGDVKLVIPLSLLLGWPRGVVGIFAGFVIGAVFGVFLLMMGRKRWRQPIPFGPFLILGALIGLLWGRAIWEWYIQFIG